ncbi:PREDICTED: mucin-15 isoform X2 [Poecilia mexicana]|uniref:mucin-15 isoform X2 n=1 Tax=Poecilia mexicana TaxID=48701 RepID=UPI00072E6A24|nr:PREDICTED: mucin-15 isoform X2 [Poecilia mexicana]
MKPLKITASLLLLLQAFHLVCLQNSTDSPGRTIDKAWLRQLPRNEVQSENAESSGDGGFDQGTDQVTAFNNGLSSGIASGFMAEEEENMTSQDKSANSSDFSTIIPHAFENETTEEPKLPDAAISPRNVTTASANSSQTNMTNPEEEFNSTTTADNTTNAGGLSNNTNLQSTTTTVKPATTTVTPEKDKGLRNLTGNTNTSATTTAAPEINRSTTTTTAAPEINRSTTVTTAAPEINRSTTVTTAAPEINRSTTVTTAAPEIKGSTTVTTAAPEIKGSTTKSSTTTEPPSETTTTAVLNTPESANKKIAIGSDRGSATDTGSVVDPYRSKRSVAWLAVLGTAAVTAVVGLVAYIILKKKHQKAFTHRKLVEEYPSDPVLRLDNGEPLDLNYGSSAYYNPGLQGDSIQMTNIPGRR